jgi:signal peptidase I
VTDPSTGGHDDGDLFTAGGRVPRGGGDEVTGAEATRDAVELTRHVDRPKEESLGSFLKELPILLLIAFGLAFLLRTFVVQVFYIPSESMVPTLEVNDRIVVEKLSYRLRGPERGEVVVFAGDAPFNGGDESGVQKVVRGIGQFLGVVPVDARDLVKRIIGLPGDRIDITGGQVSVNGVRLDEPYALLDDDTGSYTVPDGQLFVMGDNRSRSADSRSSLGFIALDDVVGRAVVRIWPLDRFGSVEGVEHAQVPNAAIGAPPTVVPVALARAS